MIRCESNKPIEPLIEHNLKEIKRTMSVKFDESSIFLDDLFKHALKLALNQAGDKKLPLNCNSSLRISVGIDIVCYGAFNSKMAYVTINETQKDNLCFSSIEMTEDHIGNLKVLPKYTNQDIYFIEQFQSIIKNTFQCFGKRWYELTSDDLKVNKTNSFKIIERNEFPCIYFDEARCYTTNRLVSKFFETMLKCVGISMRDYDRKLKNLCITIPSDFHTYQRLTLKNCLETIGLNNYIMVNKSTSLALPFLAKNLDDSTKKFIIDFGSGYMNCSILEMTQRAKLTVVDQLADKTISSKDFFENCFSHLISQLNKKTKGENNNSNSSKKISATDKTNSNKNAKIKHHQTQLRYELYKKMNTEENRNSSTIKEIWTVNNVPLNMKKIGAEQFANNVLEKLKKTSLIDKTTSKFVTEIKDILICSDAVIYEYLEPLLKKYCNPSETNIVFMDNDCATLGAAFLASSLLKVETFDILPFSIGMGLYTGVVKKIINAKTSFPCSGNHLFQTIVKNQKTIRFNVYEGESPLARNCKHICEIVIENLRKAPAGRLVLDVQIEFDEYGLLDAYATDHHTKEKLDLKIHLNNLHNIEFKRDESNSIVNIDQKLDPILMARDRHIASFLDDLDAYLEYLVTVYKKSPETIKTLITRKVLLAKKFISKNRLKVSLNECYQIAGELEEIIDKNRPILDNLTTHNNNNNNNNASNQNESTSPSENTPVVVTRKMNHIFSDDLKNEINEIDKVYEIHYLNKLNNINYESDDYESLKKPYNQSRACIVL